MKNKDRLSIRIARGLGRSVLKLELHPLLYIITLLLALAHTFLCFLDPASALYSILNWADPATYVSEAVVVYLLLGPCLITGLGIIIQVVWALQESTVSTSVAKHYLIKISTTVGFVMCYALALPLIQGCITMITHQVLVERSLGLVTLVVFLVVVYPYCMFLVTDLSPQNKKLFAMVYFPSCFTVLNLYRPIGIILMATGNLQYSIIPASLMFVAVLGLILKYPTITWMHNKLSQGYFACLLWIVLCRFVEMGAGQDLGLVVKLIGVPVFVGFMAWLLRKRVSYILGGDKNSVLKLKLLYLGLSYFEDYSEELDSYIVNHYRLCPKEGCCCHRIMGQIREEKLAHENHQKLLNMRNRNNKRANSKFSLKMALSFVQKIKKSPAPDKSKQRRQQASQDRNEEQDQSEQIELEQYEKLKLKEKTLWYELLNQLQKQQFTIEKMRALSASQKQQQMKKAKQIILDQTEILHYFLDRQYQSLRNMWYFDEVVDSSFMSIYMQVRFCIEEEKHQETITTKSRQEGSNQYALNFFNAQTSLLNFRGLLLKAASKSETFWKELGSRQPDQKKIIACISDVLHSNKKILKELKKYTKTKTNSKSKANNEYELRWEQKVKRLIESVYAPFQVTMQLASTQVSPVTAAPTEAEKEPRTLEKNLVFYDIQAKTGMAVVNIQEGEGFGSISNTNKEFWEIFSCQRYEKAKVNHFLNKQMHEHHDRIVTSFLHGNQHFLNLKNGYAYDGRKMLIKIEFSAEMIPSVYDGLSAAVFMQKREIPFALFLTNKASNIISYNQKFYTQFLEGKSLQDFDQIVNKELVQKLEEDTTCVIVIEGAEYTIENCHSIIYPEEEQKNLYYCAISETRPAEEHEDKEGVLEIEETEKESVMVRDNETKSTRKERNTSKRQEKDKQQKQSLQNIVAIIKSEKRSSWSRKWSIFILVALLLIGLVAIVCAGLSQYKINTFANSNSLYTKLTNMIQHLTENVYLVRKINVSLFGGDAVQVAGFVKDIRQREGLIKAEKDQLGIGVWTPTFNVFTVTTDNRLLTTATTFEMIMQSYILSPYTTLIENLNTYNFDYIKTQVSVPYTSSLVNFMSIIYNTYYAALPALRNEFRQKIEASCTQSILRTPIAIISGVIIFLGVLMAALSLWLRHRVSRAYFCGLKLLEKLQFSRIQERVEALRMYREGHLLDLLEEKKAGQSLGMAPVGKQKSLLSEKITAEAATVEDISRLYSVDNMETTSRDLQMTGREKDPINENKKKDKNRLSIKPIPKHRAYFCVVLGIFPIIVLSTALAVTQISYNYLTVQSISLKSLYSTKLECVKLLKAYSYQIGLEVDFVDRDFAILRQLSATVQKAYETSRQIEELQRALNPALNSRITSLTGLYFCNILATLQAQGKGTGCDANELAVLTSKSINQIQVDYIESARNMYELYKEKLSVEQQRAFMQDYRHGKLSRLEAHLVNIHSVVMQYYEEYFSDFTRTYQLVIVLICAGLLLTLLAIRLWWSTYQTGQLETEMEEVKTILQLVSEGEINNNPEIKGQLLGNEHLFSVLA